MTVITGAQALTEDTTRVQGIIAGCTEAAALVIAHIINGTPLNSTQLRNLITGAQAANMAGTGGTQDRSGAVWDLAQFGISAQQYGNPAPTDIGNIIEQALSQNKPIEVQVTQGDQLSGEPPWLHGHAITIVGSNGPGQYIVADPNTPQAASGGFVTDTLQQIINADPFAITVPTSSGPGSSSSSGGVFNPLSPGDWQKAIEGGIGGAAGELGTGMGAGFATAFQGMFKSLGNSLKSALWAPFQSLGIASGNDLLWRTVFISIGILLAIIGAITLAMSTINDNKQEIASAAMMAA